MKSSLILGGGQMGHGRASGSAWDAPPPFRQGKVSLRICGDTLDEARHSPKAVQPTGHFVAATSAPSCRRVTPSWLEHFRWNPRNDQNRILRGNLLLSDSDRGRFLLGLAATPWMSQGGLCCCCSAAFTSLQRG